MKLYRIDAATTWSLAFWLVFGLAPVLPWSEWHAHPNAAAWIQAYGSIAAILASAGCALWIFRQQDLQVLEATRSDRAAAVAMRSDLIKVIGKLLSDAEKAFPGLVPGDNNSPHLTYLVQRFEDARRCLNDFPASVASCSAEMLLLSLAKVNVDRLFETLKAFAAGDTSLRNEMKSGACFLGTFLPTDYDRIALAVRAGDRDALDRILDGHIERRSS